MNFYRVSFRLAEFEAHRTHLYGILVFGNPNKHENKLWGKSREIDSKQPWPM